MAKYYKLLKDLPTYKKGDLFRLSGKGSLFLVDPNPPHWKDTVMAYHHSTLEHFPNILKDWFEEVEEPTGAWEPRVGDEYFTYNCWSGIVKKTRKYDDDTTITDNLPIGNLFRTRKEAEKALEWLKALTEAKKDGLIIKGYYYNHEDLVILADIGKCNKLTLDTLFGKEID